MRVGEKIWRCRKSSIFVTNVTQYKYYVIFISIIGGIWFMMPNNEVFSSNSSPKEDRSLSEVLRRLHEARDHAEEIRLLMVLAGWQMENGNAAGETA
jgi:hypothetical protein